VEFDKSKGLIYASTGGGEGTLSIFHQDSPDKYALVQNVKTLSGARTMALDRKTGTVYLPVADLGCDGRKSAAPAADGSGYVLRAGCRAVGGTITALSH
jgi:hypothetical protein